jgi:hypothetical protein
MEALHLATHGHRTVIANSLPIAEDWVLVQRAPEDFAGLEDDGFFLRGHEESPENGNADTPALLKGGPSAQLEESGPTMGNGRSNGRRGLS